LQVLDQISTRTNGIALAIERLERDLTIEEYSAVCEQISAMYRTLGDLQAVAATAGTRAGGYKGAKSTNAIRSVSNEKRLHIKADFERASVSGTAKEEIYRILARRHRVSDRTVRRVISNRR